MDREKSQRIKLIVAASVMLVLIIGVVIRMIIYQKVGEKKMPYNVSKIIVVSTANKCDKQELEDNQKSEEDSKENAEENTESSGEEQQQVEENEAEETVETSEESAEPALWDFDIVQTNDIYISIDKNEANIRKNEKIKSISIKNISVDEKPCKGVLKYFMPNSLEGEKYSYRRDYLVNNSLTYRAAAEGNFKNLQIQENGGIIGISIANIDLGRYTSNEDEINYNGTLLNTLGLKDEDLKCKISFDLIIELDDGKEYYGRIPLDINCEGLVEEGTSNQEITDFSNVVFKRK